MKVNGRPAALIIGAGIAGMQAALDIANAGFPVYLIERELGIGGHMAQLDKTFPTLDCASCIITPKLADVARQPNIHLLTYSEVTHIEGEAGAFHVTVHHKPSYVDNSRCVGCSLCAEACPVSVPDIFNLNLTQQKAIHRLFAQVVPNVFGIHREGRAPCRDACPASQRIPGFISLIRERRYADALQTIKLDNPFPAICGRICYHPCEAACNRAALDAPLNIRALKRFVADHVADEEREPIKPVEPIYNERVAIIGAGPAGLTAAQDLVLAGYRVTVFEALPVAGGMLRVGVPAFRLPDDVIEREVQDILDLGVDLRLNTRVDDVSSLLHDGFKAVLVAIGAHKGVRLPIEGNDLEGVLLNTDFLRELRLGQFQNQAPGRVLVLGGGNVAMDCARTAIRLGADSVAVACLEGEDQMLAHRQEIEAAKQEGVQFYNKRSFNRILGSNGHVTGVECEQVANFTFDAEGRLHVETMPNSSHTIEADTVIFAVGQKPQLDLCPQTKHSPQGTLVVDTETSQTSERGVFAVGDVVTGTAFAIDAIAGGHRAAYSIHRYLRGEEQERPTLAVWDSLVAPPMPIVHKTSKDLAHLPVARRIELVEYNMAGLESPFAEIEAPLTEEQAVQEASRCLNCGICAECLQCVSVCEANAINHHQQAWDEVLDVGAIVIATGYDMYDPHNKPNLGYGKYANVMHAMEMERLLSASGPTAGQAQLPDGTIPHDVVFIQCVGSRDRQNGNPYCSRVCCMYTAKQAHLIRDRIPDANITVFYIDIRAFGKGYEEFHERVRHERILYRRGNVSEVIQGNNGKLIVKAEDTLLSKAVEVEADLVVLATALIPRFDTYLMSQKMGLLIGEDGFYQEAHPKLDPSGTDLPGIFLAGTCQGPKDIPDAIAHAKAAAATALVVLAQGEEQCKFQHAN